MFHFVKLNVYLLYISFVAPITICSLVTFTQVKVIFAHYNLKSGILMKNFIMNAEVYHFIVNWLMDTSFPGFKPREVPNFMPQKNPVNSFGLQNQTDMSFMQPTQLFNGGAHQVSWYVLYDPFKFWRNS